MLYISQRMTSVENISPAFDKARSIPDAGCGKYVNPTGHRIWRTRRNQKVPSNVSDRSSDLEGEKGPYDPFEYFRAASGTNRHREPK